MRRGRGNRKYKETSGHVYGRWADRTCRGGGERKERKTGGRRREGEGDKEKRKKMKLI